MTKIVLGAKCAPEYQSTIHSRRMLSLIKRSGYERLGIRGKTKVSDS